jgi:hypothetical protein
MSVDALLKLRDDIGRALIQKADPLKYQLSRLGTEIDGVRSPRGSAMRSRKAPVKYRDKEGHTLEEVRNPFGCERSSRLVRSSKTLLFKRWWLLAKLLREKQRSADARSD